MTIRLGIIGGGQLSLYLCEAAQGLGFEVAVISETDDAPALVRADRAFVAALDSLAAIDQFLCACDVVTFDKEGIPNETLDHLIEAEKRGCIRVDPGAGILSMLKDKALQKSWLRRHKLPTLPFHILSGSASLAELRALKFAAPLVQKARCGGYDGRGVQILASGESLQALWDVPSIVEPYLAGCREIAVLTTRSRSGDIQTYPPVSMEFDSQLNAVKTVSMPADISAGLRKAAVELAQRTVTLLDGVGVFAIEMFVTPEGGLLINEISPRVHNSGHLTLDACNVSQFEQHVRAVSGLPLVAISQETPAAMLNILYKEDMHPRCPEKPVATGLPDTCTTVYWYGKAPGDIGRKMGHVNATAHTVDAALESATRALVEISTNNAERAA